MSAAQVLSLARELPRLIAEENLRMVDVIAVGNGLLKDHESRRLLKAWRKEAEKDTEAESKNRFDFKRDRHKIAGFGIGIREVKKNAD